MELIIVVQIFQIQNITHQIQMMNMEIVTKVIKDRGQGNGNGNGKVKEPVTVVMAMVMDKDMVITAKWVYLKLIKTMILF